MRMRSEWALRQDDDGRWFVDVDIDDCCSGGDRVEGSYETIQGAITAAYRWEETRGTRGEARRDENRRAWLADIDRRIKAGEDIPPFERSVYQMARLLPSLPLAESIGLPTGGFGTGEIQFRRFAPLDTTS